MIVAINEISKVLHRVYGLETTFTDLVIFTFEFDPKMSLGQTRLVRSKIKEDTIFAVFKTSFGIFHQCELSYNDVLVVLLRNVNGALKEHRDDLIMSSLTYPPIVERRTLSCGTPR